MGSSSSKFKKYLYNGDEFAAMQVFQSSSELQKNLNPNLSYGEHYNHDTALHFAAKHGMKHLLRTFLYDLGGNPNKKNGNNETCLHAACQLTHNKSFSAMERRAACVMFIMQWRGAIIEAGGREKIDLAAQDRNGNTALHVAAASGLELCVRALISAGSSLYIENNEKMTPCDIAVKNGHFSIAQLLESNMVFNDNLDFHNEDELSQTLSECDEVYCGLRTQDLQEAKDQLLVETSDMLQVPLFTAEALLRDNEWSREILLEKWMKDAVSCCQLAGVEPPASAFSEQDDIGLDSVPNSPVHHRDLICDICMLTIRASEQPLIKISCNHNFCFQCWKTYLSNKIIEGMQHDILCPAYQCHILVPIDVIERLVSPDLARRYLHFDIKAFVESNKYIKWCPIAGCGRAVRLPESEQVQTAGEARKMLNGKPLPSTSHSVDCGNGHFFCWECLGEAHAPSGCAQWREWQEKVNQIKPEELRSDMKDLEDASNCLWLVSNSKPCPNCRSPIQKNEGCNHIKCSKCKFDFCWVCLEAWKKHSSATGGYFRCNRFPAASKADEKQGVLISEALARSQKIQEINRFLHYYTKYKTHEHSRKLEETLLKTLNHKMEVLASSLVNWKIASDKETNCVKFIEDGVRELLKARRVLCGSYVHGFYLEDLGCNNTIFDFMQNELEMVTEKLSEMVARPYLKTPRLTIMQTTTLCRKKRHEFLKAVSKGLIQMDTPTFKKRKRRFPGILVVDPSNEDDMSHLIVASLKPIDVNNAWVKDSDGKNSNLAAIYDWPDLDSEEETEVSQALAVSLVGKCRREGCNRPKARKHRTQGFHDFCSLRCAQIGIHLQSVIHDDSMDLIIALEMSRLQMIEDEIKRETHKSSTSPVKETSSDDIDLNRAIELSIQQEKSDYRVTTEDITPRYETAVDRTLDYQRTNEDLAVDYFLKSLAGKDIGINKNSQNIISHKSEKCVGEKELISFRPHRTEDGRFEIGDIHESCFLEEEPDELCLRRVRSTGDLNYTNSKKDRYREDPRYHLDSDHSSQHVERPEEMVRKSLAPVVSLDKIKNDGHYKLLQQNSGNSVLDDSIYNQGSVADTVSSDSITADMEVCNILSSNEPTREPVHVVLRNLERSEEDMLKSVGNKEEGLACSTQSIKKSLENDILESKQYEKGELTIKSALMKNAVKDLRNTVKPIEREERMIYSAKPCNVSNGRNEFLRHCPERASTGKIKNGQIVLLENQKTSAKSATGLDSLRDLEKNLFTVRNPVSENFFILGSENKLTESHKKAFKAAGGKIIHKNDSNLRIRVGKSPIMTDSSNEFETETGIPKSPTLFISGVSISRTPEPALKEKKSPEHKSWKHPGLKSSYDLLGKNYSTTMLNETQVESTVKDKIFRVSGRQSRSSSLTNTEMDKKRFDINYCSQSHQDEAGHQFVVSHKNEISVEGDTKKPQLPSEGVFSFDKITSRFKEESEVDTKTDGKSKSASELEREREMFPFPKSSTDGALSSVLHVHENYLSSDDFHEVLFLLERSPKQGSKRKKKSKKERDKMKENSIKDENSEVSSAL